MGSGLRLLNLILSQKYWFLEFSQLPFQGSHETQGPRMGRQEKAKPCPLLRDHRSETTTPYHSVILPLRDHHHETTAPYHSLIPDDRHPLLRAVGALRDQGEVVLSNGLLGRVEGTVSTAGHLEISTTRNTQHQLLLIFTSDHP